VAPRPFGLQECDEDVVFVFECGFGGPFFGEEGVFAALFSRVVVGEVGFDGFCVSEAGEAAGAVLSVLGVVVLEETMGAVKVEY